MPAEASPRAERRPRVPLAPWLVPGIIAFLAAVSCERRPGGEPAGEEDVSFPPSSPVEVVVFEGPRLTLLVPAPVSIETAAGEEVLFSGLLSPRVSVQVEDETISFGGRSGKGPLEVWLRDDPGGGSNRRGRDPRSHLGIESPEGKRHYRGGLIFTSKAGGLRVVNRLSLEEYIAGVIGAEMPLSYPLEALKAQAIASRTYALYEILWQREHGGPRPFPASTSFQAYRGVERGERKAVRAVQETAGEVLAYQGALFRAYFHSACGGKTLPAAAVFGDAAIPPLNGAPCGGCATSPLARWEDCRPSREIETALAAWARDRGLALGAIEEITVAEAEEERALYLRIRHAGGSFEMRVDRFRSLLARGALPLRSSTFRVRPAAGGFCFEGQGFGHRAGLCQVGAGEKGERQTCRQILADYYPQSEIIEYSF